MRFDMFKLMPWLTRGAYLSRITIQACSYLTVSQGEVFVDDYQSYLSSLSSVSIPHSSARCFCLPFLAVSPPSLSLSF